MIYAIVALLIFGFLIMIHEFGHFQVARLCGVDIEEFSIGMGPKIYQRKTKKTGMLFSVRALPIGGYVSMKGEETASDDVGSFSSKSVWRRMAIVVAGALMNLLLGFLIVFIIVCSSGALASTNVYDFLDGATSNAEGGLMSGDKIVAVGDVSVFTGEELTYEIMNQGYQPISVTVIRDGARMVLPSVVFPNLEENGVVFGNADFRVTPFENPSLWTLMRISARRSVSLIKMVWDSLYNLVTGRYAITALSSPIGITAAVEDTISGSGWSAEQVVDYVLYITAVISINLGVFNLIPFPALDGGKLFFLVVEAVSRKRVPAEVEAKINFVGIALLMLLMAFVVIKDIISLF